MTGLTFTEFQRFLSQVKSLFPSVPVEQYFKYLPEKGTVLVKKKAPASVVYAFHQLRSPKVKKEVPPQLPEQLLKTILQEYQDFRPYRNIRKTGPGWALIVYDYFITLRLHRPIQFTISFQHFVVSVTKRGFLQTQAHSFDAQLTIHSPNGDLLFTQRYFHEEAWSYDQRDDKLLRDLLYLFQHFAIIVDPFLHDQIQDLLVLVRKDADVILRLTRSDLSIPKLEKIDISQGLIDLSDQLSRYRIGTSRFAKMVFLPSLNINRFPKIHQIIQFRSTQGGRWKRGKVQKILHPLYYSIQPEEEGLPQASIPLAQIRRISLDPLETENHRMNILQFFAQFPVQSSRTQMNQLLSDE